MPDGQPMRIQQHPILGPSAEARPLTITVDGTPIAARDGEPIAAAIAAAGIRVHRYTEVRKRPRGVFCGIGQCTDCAMVVNGVPGVRTCITPIRDGMVITTQVEAEKVHSREEL